MTLHECKYSLSAFYVIERYHVRNKCVDVVEASACLKWVYPFIILCQAAVAGGSASPAARRAADSRSPAAPGVAVPAASAASAVTAGASAQEAAATAAAAGAVAATVTAGLPFEIPPSLTELASWFAA